MHNVHVQTTEGGDCFNVFDSTTDLFQICDFVLVSLSVASMFVFARASSRYFALLRTLRLVRR